MNYQNLTLQANNVSHISRLTLQGNTTVLKEGSSVFVKVLADKGNGVYEGSVAGHRVHINSAKGLEVGSSFVASISSKNGTIYITPKEVLNVNNNPYIQINTVEGNQLATLLARLGVPVNQLSGNILKMMMMMEMKIDGDVLRNIFVMASRHKGREKAASEILLLLKDKQIDVSEDELEALLAYLEGYNGKLSDIDDYRNQGNSKDLINKINKKENGWTIVPYNLLDVKTNEVIGSGILRLLYSKYKDLKKINLNCYFNEKEYLFSLLFEAKKLSSIKFNINPIERNEEYYVTALTSLFLKQDKEIDIEFVSPSIIEGCGSEGEKIYSFEGEA